MLVPLAACGEKKGDPTENVGLALGTPTLDAQCTLTIPGTITLSEYVNEPKDGWNPFDENKKRTDAFASATGQLAFVTFGSESVGEVCSAAGVTSAETGVSCILGSLPGLPSDDADWYSRRPISVTWNVTSTGGGNRSVSTQVFVTPDTTAALVADSPTSPPTITTRVTEGQQPPCEASGQCQPGVPATITAGYTHSCGVNATGAIICWGDNTYGQLGSGTTDATTGLATVNGPTQIIAVAAGQTHTCTLTSEGLVWCWGSNNYGQVGRIPSSTEATPVAIPDLSNVVQIAVGSYHNCALIDDGTVKCWGSGHNGQRGDGIQGGGTATPVVVAGITTATAVSAGANFSCALLADETVKCWGGNGYGQIGSGTNAYGTADQADDIVLTPTTVTDLSTVVALQSANEHSCALLQSGAVKCWGYNGLSALGGSVSNTACQYEYQSQVSSSSACSSVPVPLGSLTDAVALALGDSLSCVLSADNRVRCWGAVSGSGRFQNFGEGGIVAHDATAVSAGGSHLCYVSLQGEVACAGLNQAGQLGNGTIDNDTTHFDQVAFAKVLDGSIPLRAQSKSCTTFAVSAE